MAKVVIIENTTNRISIMETFVFTSLSIFKSTYHPINKNIQTFFSNTLWGVDFVWTL